MANIEFEVLGHPREIAVATYQRAMNLAFGVLTDLDQGITGVRHGGLRWYIDRVEQRPNIGISLRVYSREKERLRKRVTQDPSPQVAGAFVNSFDDLENRAVTPAYLSEFGLLKAHDMASLIGKNGATGFAVSAENSPRISITQKTSEHVDELLPVRRTAIGSIEGTLEKISVHKKPHFVVYHSLSKRAITCEIQQNALLEVAKNALGDRVIVSGVLQKNSNGETMRVRVERLRPIGRLHLVPRLDPTWAEPDFTDAPNSTAMLRRIRGA